MGCFLACFGSSKDSKSRKRRPKVQPRSQRNASYNAQSTVSLEQSNLETHVTPVKKVRDDKAEEQLGSSARKKVTFDTNIKTYEQVLVDESTDLELHDDKEGEKKGKLKEENLAKPREPETSSEHSSITSSSSSYPPNHRYQNYRESDEEDDELDYEESDLGDDDDEDDDYMGFTDGEAVESKDSIRGFGRVTEGADGLVEGEAKPIGLIRCVRDRGGNVHPVLHPVENLAQWKAVKAKGSRPFKLQKENLCLEQEEPRLSSSSDPRFKELPFGFKSRSDHEPKKPNEEVSVDASLSNWLSSTETTPVKKSSTSDGSTPERRMNSQGSNPLMSPEDRPILGALTLEEIKKFSASSLPRRSPSRSPDEMPIIGTVGTYWSHESTIKEDSGSAASFKGIPNTTSKYREDKKVNWHSTPFETRLERALNRVSEAYNSNEKIC